MKLEKCTNDDLQQIYEIINDAARAYKGVISEDCYHEPYMSLEELSYQIENGVQFWCVREHERIMGVMGIQEKTDVTLIRHAYVCTESRNRGIGTSLLRHLMTVATKPILIGTWANATWAIAFYQKNGFNLVLPDIKNKLLAKYWTIPERQVETSVVLSNTEWPSQD
jgi:N-acetylglutamate synthase-like GNAT family acetyltransferase